MAKNKTAKLNIGTVTLPGREAIKVNKDFDFEYVEYENLADIQENDKEYNEKAVVELWNTATKANARSNEYQKQLRVLGEENPLTPEMKEKMEFDLAVKAFMKATGKSEETARQILTASKQ